MLVRIFYRNRAGKDTKIVGWSTDLTQQPANQYQSYVDLEIASGDISYQSANQYGAFTKKIVDGALVERDQADLDKDRAKKTYLIEHAEEQIKPYLQGREKVTMLMFACDNMFLYLKALQDAAGVSTASMSAEGQTARATLQSLRDNISVPVNQIMSDRDAALALLDQED